MKYPLLTHDQTQNIRDIDQFFSLKITIKISHVVINANNILKYVKWDKYSYEAGELYYWFCIRYKNKFDTKIAPSNICYPPFLSKNRSYTPWWFREKFAHHCLIRNTICHFTHTSEKNVQKSTYLAPYAKDFMQFNWEFHLFLRQLVTKFFCVGLSWVSRKKHLQ